MFDTNIMTIIAKHSSPFTMFNMIQAYPRMIGDVVADKQVFVINPKSQDVQPRYSKLTIIFNKAEIDIIERCIKTCRRIFVSSAAIAKIHWCDTTFTIKLIVLDINKAPWDLEAFCKHRRVAKYIKKCSIEIDIQMTHNVKEQFNASKMMLIKTSNGSVPVIKGHMLLKDIRISPKVIINAMDVCIPQNK